MNLKQLYIFGMENSQEPVIKNPVLRAALEEPRTMAQEPRIGLDTGGPLTMDMLNSFTKIKEFDRAWQQYKSGGGKWRKGTFFKAWAPENMAHGGRIIGKPGGLVEPGVEYYSTSKVYNEKTGHIYPGGNAHSNWWSDKPGINQHKISLKDIKVKEKVEKFIIDNPDMNQKEGSKILGRKQAELVPADQWENPGKKRKKDPTETQKRRRKKTIARSSESMEAKMAASKASGFNLSHMSLDELTSLKNLGYLPKDINIKSFHAFEKKQLAVANKIKEAQKNTKLSLPERRALIAKHQKEGRALRQEFPKFANSKARLVVRATSLDKSGIMLREKIIDPTLTISQEAGTTLKGITPSTRKGKDLLKLSKKSLEAKLKSHLNANPKLALQIQKQLDAGGDITKILNSPAIKKGMPNWVKGEIGFVVGDIINSWTKGQSFWKGLGKGIETGSFDIIDLNTDERALLSKGKKLVDQGVITQQEFDSMGAWLKYTEALKDRRATQEDLFSAAEDLKENEDLGGINILEGETAGWNTLEAGVLAGGKQSDIADKNLNQSIDSYHSITDEGSMGYDTMSKVMDHLVGEEWNKPAGTVIDRGKRLHQGEGILWGGIGNVIRDVWNLGASPWQGLKDSHTLEQAKMNFKKNTPQERIMEHPVHGFEEAKLKHPEAWEDIYYDMDSSINPTEQLWKAEGGIMSLKKKW